MQYLLEGNQFVFAVVVEIPSKVQSTTQATRSGQDHGSECEGQGLAHQRFQRSKEGRQEGRIELSRSRPAIKEQGHQGT